MILLDVFANSYVPEIIINREKEQETIKNFLQDVLKGMNKVLCIHGKPEVGKTVATKHILHLHLKEEKMKYLILILMHHHL
jgi:Cdc6-like AAA superfamily ATPase